MILFGSFKHALPAPAAAGQFLIEISDAHRCVEETQDKTVPYC